MRLVARCVRGLEPTVAAEILEHGLGTITRIGHREVHFRPSDPAAAARATGLRTADDVLLLAARAADVGPARSGLARLAAELVAATDPAALLRQRAALGGSGGVPGGTGHPVGVAMSASFLGRRNYSRYDIEDAVGPALARPLGTGYHSRRAGAAPPPGYDAWRLTLDGASATLLLRIADRPLHRRAYKQRTIPGTLHPPVAAALARLADVRPGDRVHDPSCGAGTLLLEAAQLQPGARFSGTDIAREALRAARGNAAALPAGCPPVELRPADAGALPLASGSVDRVLCNPPWGGQAPARGRLAAGPGRWWRELRRVLAPGGTAALLLPDTERLSGAIGQGLTPAHVQQLSLSGAHPYLVEVRGR